MIAALLLLCAASAAEEPKAPVADIIPITMGNIRGHRTLNDEGWFIVPSGRRALAYAREKSLESAASALWRARNRAEETPSAWAKDMRQDAKESAETTKAVAAWGTESTGRILRKTHELSQDEAEAAKKSLAQAADAMVLGYIGFGRRTAQDRQALAELPGGYFRDLKGDFSNVWELTAGANRHFAGRIRADWAKAARRAKADFREGYEKSGKKTDSLSALGPLLWGYCKLIYHGLLAPAGREVKESASAGGRLLLFPTEAVLMASGRTVQAAGLSVYYAGKTGVKIISPTVEAGFLTGMAFLAAGAVPATYAAGGAWGAVNQVAFTAAAPAVGAVQGAATAAADTGKTACLVAYDAARGTTELFIHQLEAGVVLGYSALTALPTHALMGAGDAAVLLVWDGPRLALAAARGRVKLDGGKPLAATELPVGTVLNVGALRQEGAEVRILSEDPSTIREVLRKLPDDLREQSDSKSR